MTVEATMGYAGQSVPNQLGFELAMPICKGVCRIIGIADRKCWERVGGRQRCKAKLPLQTLQIHPSGGRLVYFEGNYDRRRL